MKKILKKSTVLIAALTMLSALGVSAGAVNTNDLYLRGDADGSGYLSIYDVTVIQRYLAGSCSLSGVDLTTADVNGNGLDVKDATAIQRYLAEFGNPRQIGEWVTSEQPTTVWIKPSENELPFIFN